MQYDGEVESRCIKARLANASTMASKQIVQIHSLVSIFLFLPVSSGKTIIDVILLTHDLVTSPEVKRSTVCLSELDMALVDTTSWLARIMLRGL